jgi:hypothetical protein
MLPPQFVSGTGLPAPLLVDTPDQIDRRIGHASSHDAWFSQVLNHAIHARVATSVASDHRYQAPHEKASTV